MGPDVGEMIGGRYRVEEVLGTGGMGRVVAARDTKEGTLVAVKLLVAPAWQQVLVERFFREARAVNRIDSRHVVKVLAVSAVNEAMPFIVMERLSGRDLGRRIREDGPLSLREVADYMVQACDALASSHAAGIVHRDVKPSNLFEHVTASGERMLKVLDFGISKARGQAKCEWTLTTTRDVMLGSPPYMSPEHLRDARNVDHRTDIWSLGVVAYQLLTGRMPFDGKSVGQLFTAVLEHRFTALGTARPGLPAGVEALVHRCLEMNPDDRFQNATELARAFAPYASPAIAALVDTMATKVAMPNAVPAKININGRLAEVALHGEPRTMTIAPPGGAPVATPIPTPPAVVLATDDVVAPAAAPASEIEAFSDQESQALTTVFRPRLSQPSSESLSGVASSPRPLAAIGFRRVASGANKKKAIFAAAGAALVAVIGLGVLLTHGSATPAPIAPATAVASAPLAPPAPTVTTTTTAVATANDPAANDDITFTVEPSAKPKPAAAPARTPKRAVRRK